MSLGAVLGIASIGLSLFGSSKKKKAAKSAARAEAAVHEFNATMNELAAKYAERSSIEGQHIMAEQRERGLSTIRAKYGKAGVTGVTPYLVRVEAAEIYARNQARFAEQKRIEAEKYRNLAQLDRMKARAAIKGGHFGAQAAWTQGISDIVSFGLSGGFEPILDVFSATSTGSSSLASLSTARGPTGMGY